MHGMRRITPLSSPPTQLPVTAPNFLPTLQLQVPSPLKPGVLAGYVVYSSPGLIREPSGEELSRAKKIYLRRFPYAALAEVHLWVIRLDYIKLTDNRLGFGKKIIWEKPG